MRTLRSSNCVLNVKCINNQFVDLSRYRYTISNTAVKSVRGKFGCAGLYDGSTSYLNCGNDSSLNITDAITIEAWMKIIDNTVIYQAIINKRDAVLGNQYLFRLTDSGYLHFGIQNMPGGGLSDDTILDNNIWYHVAATYDKQNVHLFINGIDVEHMVDTTNFTSNTANVFIGRRTDSASQFFNGTIDEVRIYNVALTPAEIAKQYISQLPYYKFENMKGTI